MEYETPKVVEMNGDQKGPKGVIWQTTVAIADVFLVVIIGITISQVDLTPRSLPSNVED